MSGCASICDGKKRVMIDSLLWMSCDALTYLEDNTDAAAPHTHHALASPTNHRTNLYHSPHTTGSVVCLCVGGRRPCTAGAAMTAEAGVPRAPGRVLSTLFWSDPSQEGSFPASLHKKHKFRFFPPLHRLFNSDNGSLLLSRLLRPPAGS